MAGDMYDAADWTALIGKPGWKAGYRDGSRYAWPAAAWSELGPDACINISVLANPVWDTYDREEGNAGAEAVAAAVALRLSHGQWSVVYCNGTDCGPMGAALHNKGVGWMPAERWPAAGVYLWAANPGIAPGHVPAWCPVPPVAVQDRWEKTFDVSTTFGTFPRLTTSGPSSPAATVPPGTAPSIPPPAEADVNVPVLQQGAKGPPVRSAQLLLTQIAADGDFGPATHNAVINFQSTRKLAQDGVVGPHTWAALLGLA